MAMDAAEMRRRAVAKAIELGGADLVERVRFGVYRVQSASRRGRFHTVTVSPEGAYACDCEAGLAGRACWAQGAVYVAELERNAGVRVKARAVRTEAPVEGRRPVATVPGAGASVEQGLRAFRPRGPRKVVALLAAAA